MKVPSTMFCGSKPAAIPPITTPACTAPHLVCITPPSTGQSLVVIVVVAREFVSAGNISASASVGAGNPVSGSTSAVSTFASSGTGSSSKLLLIWLSLKI